MFTLLFATVLLATSQALVYELQNSSTANSNGSWWVIGRVVIKETAASTGQTVCNAAIDDTTASTFCRLSGYKAASIVTDDNYTFTSALTLGYEKASCGASSNIGQCKFTAVTVNTSCTNSDQLVMNCTDHYLASIPDMALSDLILPLILIPGCIFYVTLLLYLEYEDVKAQQEKKELAMKKTVTKVLQDKVADGTAVTKESPAV